MRPRPTPRLLVHVCLAVGGVVGAVVLRAPVLLVLASPSLGLLALDLAWRPDLRVRARLSCDAERLLEGTDLAITVELESSVAATVEVALPVPRTVVLDEPASWTVTLPPGRAVERRLSGTAARWGAVVVGPLSLRWTSPGGLFDVRRTVEDRTVVRVLPASVSPSELVRPVRTHQASGSRTSSARGGGTEFADLRPYAPGDRARDISWRVSARRGAPWLADRHPERRTDVILLLDAYEARHLGAVLRAARALAQGYLADRDRVGVTTLGGVMRWVEPGSGLRQEHRIADALLDSRIAHSFVSPDVAGLPPRALPPDALVIGLTPGTDPRLAEAAVGLRARGRDVVVLTLEPSLPAPGSGIDRAVGRLVGLQRRAVRDRLHAGGVPAVAWDPAVPVDAALAELRHWRRHAVAR